MGIGRDDELPLAHTEQIVLPQEAIDSFGIDCPAATPQFRRDPGSPLARPFQGNALDGIAQFQIRIRTGFGALLEAVIAGPVDPRQLHHACNR